VSFSTAFSARTRLASAEFTSALAACTTTCASSSSLTDYRFRVAEARAICGQFCTFPLPGVILTPGCRAVATRSCEASDSPGPHAPCLSQLRQSAGPVSLGRSGVDPPVGDVCETSKRLIRTINASRSDETWSAGPCRMQFGVSRGSRAAHSMAGSHVQHVIGGAPPNLPQGPPTGGRRNCRFLSFAVPEDAEQHECP